VAAAERCVTIDVTWQWLGMGPALDLANTVTSSHGNEEDLLAPPGEYERWATAEAAALGWSAERRKLLLAERERVLRTRSDVRAVIGAVADGRPLPAGAVESLNQISRGASEWVELQPRSGKLRTHSRGDPLAQLLAAYARDALRVAADGGGVLRRCPAPSCGMFYPPQRPQQRWCSTQCGTRARVARHYRRHAKH
jgi:predicted RNA-binding Zn ribbon-like protein